MCRHFLCSTRRRAIVAGILSLLLYTCLIAMACEFSLRAHEDCKTAREELGNSTVTRRKERLEKYDTAKDEQLSYLFWTWMAILFVFTFCIDAILLLPAAIFRSKFYARLYLVIVSLMYLLNLTPLMFVTDIDTRGKSVGRVNIFWFGWITAVIYIHRIFNSIIVWFLLAEIDQNPNGLRRPRPRARPSTTSSCSKRSCQINPLTPPIPGFLHEFVQIESESGKAKGTTTTSNEGVNRSKEPAAAPPPLEQNP